MIKKDYKLSPNSIINFQVQRVLAYKILRLDSEYWKKKGWNQGEYYIKCMIDIFKRLTSSGFGRLLNKLINK